jgi:hypothetical protein
LDCLCVFINGCHVRYIDRSFCCRSFYNLFDVDADVGLRVGLNLSGTPAANMWKVWQAELMLNQLMIVRAAQQPWLCRAI